MTEIRIRPADLKADRDLLVGLLLEHLTPRSTERRFHWFYQENPHGCAQVWFAMDGESDRVIGSGAIIPRLMWVSGKPQLAAVMADFWIHPDFRSLGPALKLQRTCIDGAAAAGFAFFDLPQGNMPAVYRRLKLLGEQRLTGLTKPLRTASYLQRIVGDTPVTRVLACIGDRWLMRADAAGGRSGCVIGLHQSAITCEFSELAQKVSSRYGICVVRTAEYLNWRYRDHYHLKYQVFTARHGGELRAWAIVTDSGSNADLIDLFGEDNEAVMMDLLRGVAAAVRERGRSALTCGLHASQRWLDILARVGFRERQTKPMVIHRFSSDCADSRADDWFLSYGDIDY